MDSKAIEAFFTRGLAPHLSTIIITAIIALSIPLLLHFYLYKTRGATTLPSFLLAGPSGAGKTALVTLFERGSHAAATHTSQQPLTVECSLPVSTTAASSRYRSTHDPTSKTHKTFLLADTPGHGKLRHFATTTLFAPTNLRGIIFVVDASTLASGAGVTATAEFLYEVLLILQKRFTGSKTALGPKEMPVLIAANKMDLFSALPANLVKKALEAEMTKMRTTRGKGLLDSGVAVDEAGDEEKNWLGSPDETKFDFAQMQEFNVHVDVVGGNVTGTEGADVQKWWEWIADHL